MKLPTIARGAAPGGSSSGTNSAAAGIVLSGSVLTGAVSTDAILAGLVLLASAAVWGGNLFGLWWVALPVGAVLGLLVRGTWRALAAAAATGALGWALPLAWLAGREPIERAADVVAGIMGFGTAGAAIIVLTLLLGALLCASSAWVVVALRGLLVGNPTLAAPAGGQPVVVSAATSSRPPQAPPSRPAQTPQTRPMRMSPAGARKRRSRQGKRR